MFNVIIKSIVLSVATLSAGIAYGKEAKPSKTLPESTQNTYMRAPAINDVGHAQIETNTQLKKDTTDHQSLQVEAVIALNRIGDWLVVVEEIERLLEEEMAAKEPRFDLDELENLASLISSLLDNLNSYGQLEDMIESIDFTVGQRPWEAETASELLTSLPRTPRGFLVQFGQGAWEAIQRTGDSPQEALKRLCESLPSDANREGCPDETTTDTTEPTSSEGQDPSDSSEGQDPSDSSEGQDPSDSSDEYDSNNPADDENDDDSASDGEDAEQESSEGLFTTDAPWVVDIGAELENMSMLFEFSAELGSLELLIDSIEELNDQATQVSDNISVLNARRDDCVVNHD